MCGLTCAYKRLVDLTGKETRVAERNWQFCSMVLIFFSWDTFLLLFAFIANKTETIKDSKTSSGTASFLILCHLVWHRQSLSISPLWYVDNKFQAALSSAVGALAGFGDRNRVSRLTKYYTVLEFWEDLVPCDSSSFMKEWVWIWQQLDFSCSWF